MSMRRDFQQALMYFGRVLTRVWQEIWPFIYQWWPFQLALFAFATVFHIYAYSQWPTLALGAVVTEVATNIIWGVAPVVAITLVVSGYHIAMSPSRLYAEQRAEIATLRNLAQNPFKLEFDPVLHRVMEENAMCAIFRISVRNNSTTTLHNVEVTVSSITGKTKSLTKHAKALNGFALAITLNPAVSFSAPIQPPGQRIDLHRGSSEMFDVVRLCKKPSENYLITHAKYQRLPHAVQLELHGASPITQAPSGYIPLGKYAMVIAVSADDIQPHFQKIQFWSTSKSLIFQFVNKS